MAEVEVNFFRGQHLKYQHVVTASSNSLECLAQLVHDAETIREQHEQPSPAHPGNAGPDLCPEAAGIRCGCVLEGVEDRLQVAGVLPRRYEGRACFIQDRSPNGISLMEQQSRQTRCSPTGN